jgi:hypothetical protein
MGFTFYCPKCKSVLRKVTDRKDDEIEEDYKCDNCDKYYRPDWNVNPQGLELWELLDPEDYIDLSALGK